MMAFTRRAVTVGGLIAAGSPAWASRAGVILVRAAKGAITGTLRFAGREYPCALGRAGIVQDKHEGDGGTPAGKFALREVRYRADHVARPQTDLPVFETKPADGWCDQPDDPAYNLLVRMPYKADAETMWRDDAAYDLLAVIGYNDAPPVPGLGSAIFLHLVRTDANGAFLPTAGCVAMHEPDLVAVLAKCAPRTMIDIRVL